MVALALAAGCSNGDDDRDSGVVVVDAARIDAALTDAGAIDAATFDAGQDASTAVDGGACIESGVLERLQFFLTQLRSTAAMLADWAGPLELTSFLMAPGLPQPPGFALQQSKLGEACSEPFLSEELCTGRSPPFACSSYECTGQGAGWIVHNRVDAIDVGGWSFEHVRVDSAWEDGGDGVTFTIDAVGTGPDGRDWSSQGTGAARHESLSFELALDALHDEGTTTFTYSHAPVSGEVRIGERVVATVDAAGMLVAAATCP